LDWSLDGRKLAFCLNSDGLLDIYVMDADGKNVTPVTQNGISYDPAWSPDGKKIAYAVSRKAGASQIYVMNADGMEPKHLTNDDSTNNDQPDWSPDGSQIVFVSQPIGGGGRKSEIYIMDQASSIPKMKAKAGSNNGKGR
jgi:TolB protein